MESPTKGAVDTPRKGTSSTRVIESLHAKVDELKLELLDVKNRNDELKKGNNIVAKRRDQLVEQLSNAKHENDTVNSLLQRKERRIQTLEEQLGDVTSSAEDLKFKAKTLQARVDMLQTNEATSMMELERMRVAYDIVVSSQKEYRDHYTSEIKQMKQMLETHIKDKEAMFQRNITLVTKSDATIYRSIKSITLRSQELEEKYTKRDELLSQMVNNLSEKVQSNTKDSEFLFQASKDLFAQVAQTLKIDKTELLAQYLADDQSRSNPYDADAEQSRKETQPKQRFIHLHSDSQPQIVLKKRGEHSSSTIGTPEERVRSLSRQLNNRIPSTDRTAAVGTSQRKRSDSTASSRRSKVISPSEERVLSEEISSESRYQLFDEVETATSTTSTSSRHPSHTADLNHGSSPEPIDATIVEDLQGKKKRRRRKRKKGKRSASASASDLLEKSGDEVEELLDHSENES